MLTFLAVAWLCILPSCATSLTPSKEAARQRAPQIFNAVHDAMRQWGSSVHHNGMSFFLATVPEGVLLHHGNNQPNSPTEPDWLAYEIEHAEGFARGRRPRPPPHVSNQEGDQQRISEKPPGPPADSEGGWLHVYRTTRPLQFLYVDGMSAGKTKMGTLDTQDYILRGLDKDSRDEWSTEKGGRPKSGGPMGERDRANELCKQCKEWNIQGVIRMETGFEIIKCDFSDGLEQVQALKRPPPTGQGHGRRGIAGMEFVRGLSERYQGIGSSRTMIDYSSMVSAFFFPLNLTNSDAARPDLPRLSNNSESDLTAVKAYLDSSIEERRANALRTRDWQDISDMIVSRYADRLQFMADGISSVQTMEEEITFLLDVFIDYSDSKNPDLSAAVDRCTRFYVRGISATTEVDYLLYAAFISVSERICKSLFTIRELVADSGLSTSQSLGAAVKEAKDLIEFLDWSRFKRCPACAVDEVCVIPMWPMGTVEDYYHPHCTNATSMDDGESYWGNRPGPPGDGNGRPGKPGYGPP